MSSAPRDFDLAGHGEQLRRRDLGDRQAPDRREDVKLKAPDHVIRMPRTAGALPLVPPCAGDRLECRAEGDLCGELGFLLDCSRVPPLV